MQRFMFTLLLFAGMLRAAAPDSTTFSSCQRYVPVTHPQDSCAIFLTGNQDAALVTLEGMAIQGAFTFTFSGTPVLLDQLTSGYYHVRITKSGYEPLSVNLLVFKNKIKRYHFVLQPLNRSKAAFYSFLFPGSGQQYANQTDKGYFFFGLETFAMGCAALYQLKYDWQLRRFRKRQKIYRFNDDLSQMDLLFTQEKEAHRQTNQTRLIRNAFLFALATIHAINVLDITVKWPFTPESGKSLHIGARLSAPGEAGLTFQF